MNKKEIAEKTAKIVIGSMRYVDDDVTHAAEMAESGNNDHFMSHYDRLKRYILDNGTEDGFYIDIKKNPDAKWDGDCDDAALTAADILIYHFGVPSEDVATARVFITDEDGTPMYGHLVCLLRTDDKKDAYVIDINTKKYTDKAVDILDRQLDFRYMLEQGAIIPFCPFVSEVQKGMWIESPSISFTKEFYKFVVEATSVGIKNPDGSYTLCTNSYASKECDGWDFIDYKKVV